MQEFVGWDTNNKKKKKDPRTYLPRRISEKEARQIEKEIGYQSRPWIDSQQEQPPKHTTPRKNVLETPKPKLPKTDPITPTLSPKTHKPTKDPLADSGVQ
jgi:hypothetical protein